jgi:molecular chaperone HtpG
VVALAGLGGEERTLKEDAAHLLLDEARVLEGDRPADPRSFSERLARVLEKSVAKGG